MQGEDASRDRSDMAQTEPDELRSDLGVPRPVKGPKSGGMGPKQ
jgi:hypothetical protein